MIVHCKSVRHVDDSDSKPAGDQLLDDNQLAGSTDKIEEDDVVGLDIMETDYSSNLVIGSQFTFRINVIQATGISPDYQDLFCQFRWVRTVVEETQT